MSIKKNILWSFFGMAAPLVVAITSIPYLIKELGNEIYGALTLVWLIVGYLSFLELGVGRAVTSKVSACKKTESNLFLREIIGSGFVITIVTGLFASIVLLCTASFFVENILKVSEDLKDQVIFSFSIASLGVPAVVVSSVANGVLEAFEKFKIINLLKFTQGVLNFAIPFFIVYFISRDLEAIVVCIVFFRYVFLLLLINALNSEFKLKTLVFSFDSVKSLLRFGSWITVSNVVGSIMINADRVFIASIIGISSVTYYSVPMDMLSKLLLISGAVSTVIFPRLTSFLNKNGKENTDLLLKRSLLLISFFMSIIAFFVFLNLKFVLNFWLGADFLENSYGLSCVILVGILINSIAQTLAVYILAFGESKSLAILHVFEIIFYIPILIFCLKNFGLIGAAYAWSMRMIFDMIMIYMLAKSKSNMYKRVEYV